MVSKIESGRTISDNEATSVFETVREEILSATDFDSQDSLSLGYLYVRMELVFFSRLHEAMLRSKFDDLLSLAVGKDLQEMKKPASEAVIHAGFGNYTYLKRYLHNLGEMYMEDEQSKDLGKQLLILSSRIADVGTPLAD